MFAKNLPVMIFSGDSPDGVQTLQQLAEPDRDIVLAQEGVPIAEYTDEILTKANTRYGDGFEDRVLKNVVSREPDVRAAANRVALGEADATFVYTSDVTPKLRDRVKKVEVPEDLNVVATYPISATEDAPNPKLAREWVDLVLSEKGQRMMSEWGFKRAR